MIRHRIMQRLAQGLWVGAIPALLAGVVIKSLVPPLGSGLAGIVSRVGHAYPVPLGAACFLLFSLLARYWRFRIPGGRYASLLPAHWAPGERDGERLRAWAGAAALFDALTSQAMQRRLARTLDAPAKIELDGQLSDLGQSLESGDFERVQTAAASLRSLGAGALAQGRRREGLVTACALALTLGATLGLRARVVEPYQVLSSSMLPTLEAEDRIAGRKRAYALPARVPRRGNLVVFRSAAVETEASLRIPQPDVLVKRVIGLPGDRVAMVGEVPVINGWQVPSCVAGPYVYFFRDGEGGTLRGSLVVEFLDDRAYLTLHSAPARAFEETYVVQPGEVFVLGDSRGVSVDSRFYGGGHGGGVPVAAIEARADWFLVGTRRSGNLDFSRFLKPIVGLETQAHLEGVNATELEAGIAKCLAHRPSETHAPSAAEPTAEGSLSPRSG